MAKRGAPRRRELVAPAFDEPTIIMEGLLWIVLVGLAFWIALSFIIAGHAEGQGKSQMWGAAVFFFGIFGLAGYAISLASD